MGLGRSCPYRLRKGFTGLTLATFCSHRKLLTPSHLKPNWTSALEVPQSQGLRSNDSDNHPGHEVAQSNGVDNVNNRRCWFALITFCVTPALAVALGSAVLFTGAAIAFAVSDNAKPVAATQDVDRPRERVFVGLITDDHCGARHEMDSGMNPTECTKMCVRNGSRYVLVEGNKRYALAGSESQLNELAGQRAHISGTLDGNTIRLSSTGFGQ
jgi:hypothetical protein